MPSTRATSTGPATAGASPIVNSRPRWTAASSAAASSAACTVASPVTGADLAADGDDIGDADPRVDRVAAAPPPPPRELDHEQADLARRHAVNPTAAAGQHGLAGRRDRQMDRRPLDEIDRAAKCCHHAAEALAGPPVGQHGVDASERLAGRGVDPAEHEHLGAQRADDREQPRLGRAAAQHVQCFGDLDGVAAAVPEHLVHVGDPGGRRQAGGARDVDQRARQRVGHRPLGGEGAVADLDVHRQAADAGGGASSRGCLATISGTDSTVAVTSRIA